MGIPDGHFRHILLYYFRKGKNAVQARKKLYDVALYYVNKLDIWVPHKLNEIQLTKRISICVTKRNETDPFLKRIIAGDGRWVVYDNVVRKRSWSKRDEPAQPTSKAVIHQKKVMLSV